MYITELHNETTRSDILRPQSFTQLNNEEIRLLGWNLPPEAMGLVHPHWRGYEAPPFYYHLLLGIIYFALMTTSAIGNGIVIWIFSTSKSLKTPSNVFIVNLAVFDFLMMLEMPMFLANSCAQRLLGYEIGCNIYAALGSLSGIGAAISNAMIAFDRYKTISSPIDGRLNFPQVCMLVGVTWLWTVPFTVFPTFKIWGRYVPEGYLTTCSFDYLTDDDDTRVFTCCIFIWAYAIPMILIVMSYYNLFSHVRAHEKMLKEQAKKMNVKSLSNQTNSTSVEIRIAKAAFVIFFLYVCAWTPYAVVAMIGGFGNQELLTPTATMIPAVAAKIVSCIDPWVYAISHPKYRMELEKRIPWLGVKEAEIQNNDDAKSAGTTVVAEAK